MIMTKNLANTSTETEIETINDLMAKLDPVKDSDEYDNLLRKKRSLTDILKTENEAEEAKSVHAKNAAETIKLATETKHISKIDINQIIKIAGVGVLGILAVAMNDGRILNGNCLWQKFNKLI